MRGETEWSCASRGRSMRLFSYISVDAAQLECFFRGFVRPQFSQPLKLQFREVQKGFSRREIRKVSLGRDIGCGKEG